MTNIALKLWNDDAGFVVSAELVLVSTIAVLSMVVGLSEVSYGVVQELEDTGSAFGSINQSFRYTGICGHTGSVSGTVFVDVVDFCDQQGNIVGTTPTVEGYTN
jgi:hypothetical protein